MTPRIIAALLELAAAYEEALDPEGDVAEPKPEPRVKRKRAREFPAPLSPVSDVERARARRMLRRRGIGT